MIDKEQHASLVNTNLNKNSRSFKFFNQKTVLVIIMIVIAVIVTIINQNFLSVKNLFNIISAVSVIGIATIGASMVLITGEFDLTLGAVFSVTAWLMALITPKYGATLGITVTLLAGLLFGIVTGLIVTNVKAS